MRTGTIDKLKVEAAAALIAANTARTPAEFEAAFDRFDRLLPRIRTAARAEVVRATIAENAKAGAAFWDAKKQEALGASA